MKTFFFFLTIIGKLNRLLDLMRWCNFNTQSTVDNISLMMLYGPYGWKNPIKIPWTYIIKVLSEYTYTVMSCHVEGKESIRKLIVCSTDWMVKLDYLLPFLFKINLYLIMRLLKLIALWTLDSHLMPWEPPKVQWAS